MSKLLRQSTASQEIVLGTFVDSTDGNTEETGLTIANTDIKIWVTGATTLANKNSGGATHIANGRYSAVLDATDTATLGPMKIFCHPSGALTWEDSYTVVTALVYDSLILGTDNLQVDAIQLNGTSQTARDIGASVLLSSGTGTGQLSITSGIAAVNATQIAGAAVSTTTAQIGVNVVQISGDATSADNLELYTDGTTPAPVNVTQFGGTNLTATGGRPEVNTSHWGGTAVASATVSANMTQISGDATAADNLELAYDFTAGPVPSEGVIDQGTAQSATGTTLVIRSAAAFADDELIGATVVITGGTTGVGQSRLITDNVGSTDTLTVATWTTTPTGTITYRIYGTAAGSGGGGSGPTAAEIADAVWDEATSGHTTSGTFGEQVKTDIDAILVDTGTTLDGRIPAALVSGRMDASVGAMASGVLTATAIASDAITAAKIADGAIDAATFAASAITSTVLAADAITAAKLASDAGTEIATAVWANGTRTLSSSSDPTAAAIADAVWDEARAGHTTASTFGFYLDSAISGVSTGGVSAGEIADAVWDEVLSGHADVGSTGEALTDAASGGGGGGATAQEVWEYATRTLTAGTNVDGSTFTSIPWNAAWDAEVQSEATDALNAYDPPTRAELTSDVSALATATNLATVDTVVDAIKVKTDQLTFGVTNTLNANIEYVNAVQITGNGETGTEWGPV